MSANGFREDEIVTRKVNGQTRIFPVVGGRLRLAHEENDNLSLATEMVSWDGQYAVFRCSAETQKGRFVGYGTANAQRDTRLAESLIELAETRSIARALRFAGYGVEFTGLEEVLHVTDQPEIKPGNADRPEGKTENVSRSNSPVTGNGGPTQAQIRALHALTKKARYGEEDLQNLLAPMSAATFQDLTKESASRLISYLQTEAA